MRLTRNQIKILETAFANYPEDYECYRYGTMTGIQEQLDELGDKVGLIWYVESVNEYDVKVEKFIVNMGKFIVK